jgi:hypothetical protein
MAAARLPPLSVRHNARVLVLASIGAMPDDDRYTVLLNGYAMHLGRGELDMVAAGLGHDVDRAALAAAVAALSGRDRAPTWELVVRHIGQGKAVARAAGEVGWDELNARALLDQFRAALGRAGQGTRA